MDWKDVTQGVLRWIHVVAGIAWIGHLYFFNWVNAHFAAALDADAKKKVVPELMPRALYWFRWGAAFTWFTGFLISGLVVYSFQHTLWTNFVVGPEGPVAEDASKHLFPAWGTPVIVVVALTWLGFIVYDQIAARVKDNRVMCAIGAVLIAAFLSAASNWAHLSARGYMISTGMLLGTAMAFNVWFRIWPAQKVIIAGVKNGTPVDPALAPMSGARSKHNTYMSVPLVLAMLNAHEDWAASNSPWVFFAMVLVGWALVFHLYKISKTVKGF